MLSSNPATQFNSKKDETYQTKKNLADMKAKLLSGSVPPDISRIFALLDQLYENQPADPQIILLRLLKDYLAEINQPKNKCYFFKNDRVIAEQLIALYDQPHFDYGLEVIQYLNKHCKKLLLNSYLSFYLCLFFSLHERYRAVIEKDALPKHWYEVGASIEMALLVDLISNDVEQAGAPFHNWAHRLPSMQSTFSPEMCVKVANKLFSQLKKQDANLSAYLDIMLALKDSIPASLREEYIITTAATVTHANTKIRNQSLRILWACKNWINEQNPQHAELLNTFIAALQQSNPHPITCRILAKVSNKLSLLQQSQLKIAFDKFVTASLAHPLDNNDYKKWASISEISVAFKHLLTPPLHYALLKKMLRHINPNSLQHTEEPSFYLTCYSFIKLLNVRDQLPVGTITHCILAEIMQRLLSRALMLDNRSISMLAAQLILKAKKYLPDFIIDEIKYDLLEIIGQKTDATVFGNSQELNYQMLKQNWFNPEECQQLADILLLKMENPVYEHSVIAGNLALLKEYIPVSKRAWVLDQAFLILQNTNLKEVGGLYVHPIVCLTAVWIVNYLDWMTPDQRTILLNNLPNYISHPGFITDERTQQAYKAYIDIMTIEQKAAFCHALFKLAMILDEGNAYSAFMEVFLYSHRSYCENNDLALELNASNPDERQTFKL